MVDENLARKAVDSANLNVLRMALYQATGDEELAELPLEKVKVRGGLNTVLTVAPDRQEELKQKALEFLRTKAEGFVPTVPTDDELRRMMSLMRGETLSDRAFAYRRAMPAFEEIPRAANWTDGPVVPEGFRVAVIGTGFSGLGTAVQLERLGIPYDVYERRHEVGGTWSINTYPDARTDTMNFTYQFSFVKNYPWSEYFARQGEVRRYLDHVADTFGIRPHIHFGADVTEAVWDEEEHRWRLTVTRDGVPEVVEANIVISGAGLFGVPRTLDIPGADTFEGRVLHTTQWSPDIDLAGKRVAVIGNGSTGVQLLKQVAEKAGQVYVHQRTPQWISPRENYGAPIEPEVRWLLDNMPYYWNWYSYEMLSFGISSQGLQEKASGPEERFEASEELKELAASLTKYIETQVGGDKELMAKLVPDYVPVARRLVVDNGWYASLLRDNVELVTDRIERITPTGIVTADGTEREVDVIVAAIGFAVTKYLFPTVYRGVGGARLDKRWEEAPGPMAYLGVAVPDFPNFFMLYGPNSQPRNGSIPSWIEVWSRYVCQSIVMMLENGHDRIEVRKQVYEKYNAEMDAVAETLIWSDPASKDRNYYVNEWGRSQVNAAWRVEDYHAFFVKPQPEDYHLG
ncbi:flavin-containing monooxygenase [Streptomyces mexicanus]|uniref:NAD(P)/FAD-dependent oxidoreductase n=1 Tax=Streptomyces mexicanus TaxID=178566 RepID=A0A7X1HXI2_9ACTN|nr:NAD(P)/FAD-dependent oxidoreductase [Streptomyces mexicanus]MBC2865005.1 NAD(P)/FAD-dependent oxidoreductase [Streptomyces mexicanus]